MPGITIFGVNGRMGQSLLRAMSEAEAPPLDLVGAVASPNSSRLGLDAAAQGDPTGILVSADPVPALADAAVAVDFSLAHGVAGNARACAQAHVPLLVGTTGFGVEARTVLEEASAVIPVLIASNTSIGVNVIAQLVKLATRALGPGFDVEISEAHHRLKRDAPSGTALALGEIVARARGARLDQVAVFSRHGSSSPRKMGEIGFAVMRAGDIVGDHTVTFVSAGERIEITHRAVDRITFARGALRAAEWLTSRPAGLYTMSDVLGLDQA